MNAVYYCRVSTDQEIQLNALEVQIAECEECIKTHDWNLYDSYVDEGKTGTTTKFRDEYQRLYDDLSNDNFQVIVIKSEDRLQRSVKDWYLFVDKLVQNKKQIFFYLENRFYTPDDALLTGIKVILAEEYSRDLSKKLNNAHRRRQKEGTNAVITSATWGYDNINKKIVINDEEAKIIKLIYDLASEGYGSRTIVNELSNRGITNRSGNRFADGVVRRILRNPIYKGTVVMNKKHFNFNTKTSIRNDESEWIYHDGLIPRIISDEQWELVNKKIDERCVATKSDENSRKRIGVKRGNSPLSGKIICGDCNSVYWRKRRVKANGDVLYDWYCKQYITNGRKTNNTKKGAHKVVVSNQSTGCDNVIINEGSLFYLLNDVAKDVFGDNKQETIDKTISVLEKILNNKSSSMNAESLKESLEKVKRQQNILLERLLDETITNDIFKKKNEELDKKKQELQVSIDTITKQKADDQSIYARLEEIKRFDFEEGDINGNVIRLLEHVSTIVIYNDKIDINFDFIEPIRALIVNEERNVKLFQYVRTAKYLYPQTDTYRYNNQYKKTKVKIII